MKSLMQVLATIAFCGVVFSHAFSYIRPLKADVPVTASASWHPNDWDTVLPPGINAVRPDGRRIVPNQDPNAKDYCPGETDPTVTQAELNSPKFIEDSRNVSPAVKRMIYKRDGITYPPPADKPDEIDHDVSICLTGVESSDPSRPDFGHNLWCESRYGPWNAYLKDRIEMKLHLMNKADPKHMTMAMVADDIRGYHWIWSYVHYIGMPSQT